MPKPTPHRRPKARLRLAGVFAALLAVLTLIVGGAASAHQTRPATASSTGTTVARTAAVNGASESATFRVVDDGRSMTVYGTGRGFRPNAVYVSLLYPDARCSQVESPSPQTLAGAWQPRGNGTSYLVVRLDGDAYRAVRGHIGSESVREVTGVSAGAPFTAQLTARACAPLNPRR